MSVQRLPTLRARAHLVHAVRTFFVARGFAEVDTPVAIAAPAPEYAIDAVAVRFVGAPPHPPQRRFLQTSPELQMKQLVAQGLAPIFQLAPVFRDGDYSPIHRPEFRLLEWYRAPSTMEALFADCEALLGHLAQVAATLEVHAQDHVLAGLGAARYPRISVTEALWQHAHVRLADVQTKDKLAACLAARGLHHAEDDSWADLFYRLFVGRIEPALLQSVPGPFFLTHFPLQLAALAEKSAHDPLVAERFELYAGGMELANAFGELRCATEQRQRFAEETRLRSLAGKPAYPLDEAYLACLQQLPPTAGIALGIERLLLLLLGASDIDAISFVPWSP